MPKAAVELLLGLHNSVALVRQVERSEALGGRETTLVLRSS